MITVVAGQVVADAPEYVVKDGGDFAPDDLVVCHPANHPEQEVAFLAAQVDGSQI